MFRQGDPSPTRDVAGIGLGLNLVKQFVELHGGTVTVHSDGEGKGAAFTCRFPVYQPAREARAV
jgi:signal transduction histidine kinase